MKLSKIKLKFLVNQEPLTLPHLEVKNTKMTPAASDSNDLNNIDQKNGTDNDRTNTEEGNSDITNNEDRVIHSELNNEISNDVNNEIIKIINKERMALEERERDAIANNLEENSLTIVEQPSPIGLEGSSERKSLAISNGNSLAITEGSSQALIGENSLAIQEGNSRPLLEGNPLAITDRHSLSLAQDKQPRPPWKGVMVPCGQLKEYLDSLPTFNRKTMLRKGREVHKIYVDMTKGECFLDDQFAYTEFGKLVLTNGSIRAGRAKNAKQIVVARETLYCSGTGACKRACGGYGVCAAGKGTFYILYNSLPNFPWIFGHQNSFSLSCQSFWSGLFYPWTCRLMQIHVGVSF